MLLMIFSISNWLVEVKKKAEFNGSVELRMPVDIFISRFVKYELKH